MRAQVGADVARDRGDEERRAVACRTAPRWCAASVARRRLRVADRGAELLAVHELVHHAAEDLVDARVLDHVGVDQVIPAQQCVGRRPTRAGSGSGPAPAAMAGSSVHVAAMVGVAESTWPGSLRAVPAPSTSSSRLTSSHRVQIEQLAAGIRVGELSEHGCLLLA